MFQLYLTLFYKYEERKEGRKEGRKEKTPSGVKSFVVACVYITHFYSYGAGQSKSALAAKLIQNF